MKWGRAPSGAAHTESVVVILKYQVVMGLFALSCTASAQTGVPMRISPGQVERQFQPTPQLPPPVGAFLPAISTPQAPDGADAVRFTLERIVVDGNSVLSAGDIDSATADYLGRQVTLADLYRLANTLTASYRNSGYLLSQVIVPAQTVAAVAPPVVHLRAVEGYIADVRIEGAADNDILVARYAEKIRQARPLTTAALERYMLLINDLPGIRASATLSPSRTEFGAADLMIKLTRRAWNAGLSADNRGGEMLGDTRIMADAAFANLLASNDSFGVKLAASPGGEMRYAALQNELQLGDEGLKLKLSLGTSQATPKDRSFVPLNLETRSLGLVATLAYPLWRTRRENLSVRASLTSHDGEERVFDIQDRQDRIRALRVGMTYDRIDHFGGTTLLDLEFSQGFRSLGASNSNSPLLTRAGGATDFRKLNLFVARVQDLYPSWTLLAALSGQYAFDTLLASELFGLGGDLFGRGYGPSEFVGDHGTALKLELRKTGQIDLSRPVPYRAYAFFDAGTVRQRVAMPGQNMTETARSAGLGVRLDLPSSISFSLELSKPLNRIPAFEADKRPRLFLSLSARY